MNELGFPISSCPHCNHAIGFDVRGDFNCIVVVGVPTTDSIRLACPHCERTIYVWAEWQDESRVVVEVERVWATQYDCIPVLG